MRICDCAASGLSTMIDLARLELRRRRHVGDERRHAFGLPRSERFLEHRHHRRGRDVADDQQRRVVGPVVRAIERLQIGDGERLDRRRQSVRRRAVAMRRPEDNARKRELNERRRVVARLQQAGQPFLLQSIELARRERGAQRDVGHQRQRIAELRHRDRQANRRIIKRAGRRQVGAEELERVGELERRPRAGAFIQHRRRQAADAVLPIGSAALPERTIRLTCASGTS